jgi:adenine-specific DNA-methyltransferase
MRYIGSKNKLKEFIIDIIKEVCGGLDNKVIADLFSGTTIVAQEMKKWNSNIITNDYMNSSFVFQNAFIVTNHIPKFSMLEKVIDTPNYIKVLEYLNNIDGIDDFIYNNYTIEGTQGKEFVRNYFSAKNARKIDSIRNQLNNWKINKLITEEEFYFLLASLLKSVAKVSNTSGTYGAFLKVDDNRKFNDLFLEELDLIKSGNRHTAYNEDIFNLIKNVSGDILYLDPPYNNRQYPAYYHILETIALWDNPNIYGLTGRRPYEKMKSPFCFKNLAFNAFEKVICQAKFDHIFISYSTDGIVESSDMINLLSKYGDVEIYDKTHRRYKSNSFINENKKLKELLFYVRKRKKII